MSSTGSVGVSGCPSVFLSLEGGELPISPVFLVLGVTVWGLVVPVPIGAWDPCVALEPLVFRGDLCDCFLDLLCLPGEVCVLEPGPL